MGKIIIFISVLFMLFSFSITAEETSQPAADEKKDEIQSLNEERREILKYGIDSELISLLAKLQDEENKELSADVGAIYASTLNPDIMKAAVEYFISIEYPDAVPSAEKILGNWEDQNYDTLSSALRYISEYPGKDSEQLISKLLDHENKSLASAAIAAIGKCGSEETAQLLLDYLDDDEFPDELKPSLIRALGDMESESALDTLIEILEDVDEEKSWRWTACEALGKIRHEDALPAINKALIDKDTYLRAYAIKALAGFDSAGVEETIIQALRDSFWRVRVAAAEALGKKKSIDSVGILIYKAKKDPENNVKLAAIAAIGEIGGREGLDFLQDIYSKNTTAQSIRTKAAEIIIEKDLQASLEIIKKVVAEEWEKDSSVILSYTCKFLSKAEHPGLKEIFARMLDHNDVAIKIYGVRGVQLNRISDQKERLESLTKEGVNNAVRKAALSALENL
ncbi:MAG: HEAT repeat domain-containing protein [Spirochaetales bacterium]|nr:HEAT repeat domain-containing protein [Spirochaetales bacterium]